VKILRATKIKVVTKYIMSLRVRKVSGTKTYKMGMVILMVLIKNSPALTDLGGTDLKCSLVLIVYFLA
jgi:hypothetical protein